MAIPTALNYAERLYVAYGRLKPSLRHNRITPTNLAGMLEVSALPLGSNHLEPCEPFYESMNSFGDHQDKIVIAQTLGQLIDLGLDDKKFGKNPDKLTFNALMLAHLLGYTDQLAEPLGKMYERKKLDGSYGDNDLKHALTLAIQQNQPDARYQQMWTNMIEGVRDLFLKGAPQDGIDGAIYMPESPQTRGTPYTVFMGYALGKMASVIEGLADRHEQFASILNKYLNAYLGGGQTWFDSLMAQAQLHQWPNWVREFVHEHKRAIINIGQI